MKVVDFDADGVPIFECAVCGQNVFEFAKTATKRLWSTEKAMMASIIQRRTNVLMNFIKEKVL